MSQVRPDTHHVRAYAAHVLENSLGKAPDMLKVEPMFGGERHSLYRVEAASSRRSVVVRVANHASESEWLKARCEAAILSAQPPYAPVLLNSDLSGEWFGSPASCVSYVDGQLRAFSCLDGSQANELGQLIKNVHNTDISVLLHCPNMQTPRSIHDYADHMIGMYCDDTGLQDSAPARLHKSIEVAFEQVRTRIVPRLVEEAIAAPTSSISVVHGDLNAGNVLWQSQGPVLIDWENVRLGDPAEDVAYLFAEGPFPHDLRDSLLNGYGAHDQRFRTRIKMWECVILVGLVAWWLRRASRITAGELRVGARHTDANGCVDAALERFDRLQTRL